MELNVLSMLFDFAVRGIFDKKDPVEDLQFFNTSVSMNDSTANLWIAMNKSNLHIHGNICTLTR